MVIVGAGLTGCVLARLFAENGKDVVLIEKESFPGGLCADRFRNHPVSFFGPHIFHTNDEKVFSFIKQFTDIKEYRHRVYVKYGEFFFIFPGYDRVLRKWVIRNYSLKMWKDYYPEIVKSVSARVDRDSDEYFPDKHQFLPVEGYTRMCERMISHKKITVYYKREVELKDLDTRPVFYTGALDKLFSFKLGKLPYFGMAFMEIQHNNYGKAVINYPEQNIPYIRSTNYGKLYTGRSCEVTTVEIPICIPSRPMYPVLTKKNIGLGERYCHLAVENGIIPVGRIARYVYLDMDDVVKEAFDIFSGYSGRS